METTLMLALLRILVLAFIQNVSFTIVSRSRNRDNKKYHAIAATFSNSIYLFVFRELILGDMNMILFIPYVIGTVSGSTYGMAISMKIEKFLGATSDGHLVKTKKQVKNEKIN